MITKYCLENTERHIRTAFGTASAVRGSADQIAEQINLRQQVFEQL
ncbi:MAG: hypothetical protein CM1200mP28_11120 [Deltaproteobacteria bacterium]|nr:MAG: hypothetical protein CM1200mP28_11120 [Deltaproteobacteria bacterium]